MAQTMKRAGIRVDESVYPRYARSKGTITQYSEAIAGGAKFPPLEVDQHGRLIDGVHRLMAYDINGITDIPVRVWTVRDDVEFFEKALKANAHHGHRYTHIDYAHMVLKGQELGLSNFDIAKLVNVTPGYLEDVTRDWFATSKKSGKLVPLKRTIRHMKGQKLTEDQLAANKKLSGLHPSFYANQCMLLLDNNLIDLDSEIVIAKFRELKESLDNFLRGVEKRKGVK
jgi:hypothetical protein